MKFQLVSDLHSEFYEDKPLDAVAMVKQTDADALVLAGDIVVIASKGRSKAVLGAFCDRYDDVIWVPGNHSLYHSRTDYGVMAMESLASKFPNLHLLRRKEVTINGVKIAGATLWFRDHPDNWANQHLLSDFSVIKRFLPWVYNENFRDTAFLQGSDADVFVTHHLPHVMCNSAEWRGHTTERFYYTDMTSKLTENGPKIWAFGHTHASIDMQLGTSRVISNPVGYVGEINPEYDPSLVLEV